MSARNEIWHRTEDGLRLHGWDEGPRNAPLELLCLHGLTRNVADFEPVRERFSGRYRVVAIEQRGRGRSDDDADPSRYEIAQYVRDTLEIMDAFGLQRPVLIGTSMGGIMTMTIAAQRPGRVRAAVLNDIGPAIEAEGLARIQAYVGAAEPVATWEAAAEQTRGSQGVAFPDYGHADWLAFARRLYRERDDGRLELAYDPNIAQPMHEARERVVPPDLWAVFDALLDIPAIVIRGELSDILSRATVEAMQRRKPDLASVEVPRVGHAPTLAEPEASAALEAFLGELEISGLQ